MPHASRTIPVLLLAVALALPAAAYAQTSREPDLASSVDDGFTIAVVGDVIIAHSLEHMMSNPRFAEVVEILRGADVATGNLETQIIDGRSFVGGRGGGTHGAEPESAEWLLEMGFDIMARPNNHANDYGYEGLIETSRHLDRARLQHSGFGDTYWAARSARFVTTSRGRVGMVATSENSQEAAPASGEWPGRGGLSPFNVTMSMVVPADSWDAVRTLRNLFPNGTGFYARGANTADRIDAVGQRFQKAPAGIREPYYTFDINQRDLRDVIAAVREGKQRSDFITLALHSHDFRDTRGGYRGFGVPEAEHLDTNPSIADYLPVLAKQAIDNGADVFQGTGVHVLRGIEIYNDRPIFYGLGEFLRQRDVGGLAGRGDLSRDGCEGCPFPAKYESVVAVSRFSGDRLVEVRLHPIELRYESERLAHRGIPEIAAPDVGRRILERLQELSEPLGTRITIEGNVGIIRP